MVWSASVLWRLTLAATLAGAIVISARARAPRRSVPRAELRQLVLCALGLYGVGGLASLTHHGVLAIIAYGTGIVVAALGAWLSRGRDQEDPPGAEPPVEPPPPGPDAVPWLDWAAFEREFRAHCERGHRSGAAR